MSYFSRLATFSALREDNVNPLLLARHGFCYNAARDAIRCAECNVEFGHLECLSSSSILETHRAQSSCCHFAHVASGPNIPPNLLGLALPVGGHTASDYGSQIGSDRMQCTFRSAFDQATMRGVFQSKAGGNAEPSGPVPLPEGHADPQVLNQRQVVYRREQPDNMQLQHVEVHLHTSSDCFVNGSGSDSLLGSYTCPQGSVQGQAFYKKEQLELQYEEPRLTTFSNWPANACVDRRELAWEGFVYTGQGDRVWCAFCRVYLKNWKATDIIRIRHKKYSPNCPFLHDMVVSGRQISQLSSVDSPESLRNQRVTFDDPVSAVMDREEVLVLMPTIRNLGYSENDLRTVVRERLMQGLDCLNPSNLLMALEGFTTHE